MAPPPVPNNMADARRIINKLHFSKNMAWRKYYHHTSVSMELYTLISLTVDQKKVITRIYTEQPGVDHNDCCICLEEMTNDTNIILLNCGHYQHVECMNKLKESVARTSYATYSCPYCRAEIIENRCINL